MVFNATALPFPDKTLSSSTNFSLDQLNPEDQWEVAILEISCPSIYQNVTEVKFKFFDDRLLRLSEFHYLGPGLYPSITDIVEAMNTFLKKNKVTAICLSQLKCLEERKKLRFT